jgi:hypothetical protein
LKGNKKKRDKMVQDLIMAIVSENQGIDEDELEEKVNKEIFVRDHALHLMNLVEWGLVNEWYDEKINDTMYQESEMSVKMTEEERKKYLLEKCKNSYCVYCDFKENG